MTSYIKVAIITRLSCKCSVPTTDMIGAQEHRTIGVHLSHAPVDRTVHPTWSKQSNKMISQSNVILVNRMCVMNSLSTVTQQTPSDVSTIRG